MRKFALLIGVSEYPDGLSALPAATQDVAALQRVLRDPSLGAFDEVKRLLNPNRDEMARTIEEWIEERRADDLALLFFSGHGVKDDRRNLHFAASNTQKDRNKLMRSTAIAARTLHDWLRYSLPKQQVVILDCCFSGAFGELLSRDDGDIALKDQLAAEGRVVLTSTSAVDYSFEEKEAELSIYTRYLVEGIEKGIADLNGDGFITVDELHDYASRKVKETSPVMSPDIITLKGKGYNIRIARSPQDKPELKYRKEVEKRARKGKFTMPARRMLASLRRQYSLTDEVADTIEAEVLKPFRDYQRKLDEYRDALAECVEAGPTLGRDTLVDLKDYQKHLGLKDEDVRLIEEKLVGGQLITTEKSPAPKNNSQPAPSVKQYPTFRFETVRINEQGNVIETIPGEVDYFSEDLGNGVTLDMVRIPGGKFMMGAAEGEEGASEDEYPQHEVTVPEFWMGKTAVTQAQWGAIARLKKIDRDLKPDPARFKGANRPVENVRWQDAIEFCKRLSKKAGREYQLPSEAQWEYACRAGTTTPFYFGPTITPDLANYDGRSTYGKGSKGKYRKETTEVVNFLPNTFGLYDMHGNVWEWCLDGWHDSYEGAPTDGNARKSSDKRKLLRGGSWNGNPRNCRSADRYGFSLVFLLNLIGFRVVCFSPRTKK